MFSNAQWKSEWIKIWMWKLKIPSNNAIVTVAKKKCVQLESIPKVVILAVFFAGQIFINYCCLNIMVFEHWRNEYWRSSSLKLGLETPRSFVNIEPVKYCRRKRRQNLDLSTSKENIQIAPNTTEWKENVYTQYSKRTFRDFFRSCSLENFKCIAITNETQNLTPSAKRYTLGDLSPSSYPPSPTLVPSLD